MREVVCGGLKERKSGCKRRARRKLLSRDLLCVSMGCEGLFTCAEEYRRVVPKINFSTLKILTIKQSDCTVLRNGGDGSIYFGRVTTGDLSSYVELDGNRYCSSKLYDDVDEETLLRTGRLIANHERYLLLCAYCPS